MLGGGLRQTRRGEVVAGQVHVVVGRQGRKQLCGGDGGVVRLQRALRLGHAQVLLHIDDVATAVAALADARIARERLSGARAGHGARQKPQVHQVCPAEGHRGRGGLGRGVVNGELEAVGLEPVFVTGGEAVVAGHGGGHELGRHVHLLQTDAIGIRIPIVVPGEPRGPVAVQRDRADMGHAVLVVFGLVLVDVVPEASLEGGHVRRQVVIAVIGHGGMVRAVGLQGETGIVTEGDEVAEEVGRVLVAMGHAGVRAALPVARPGMGAVAVQGQTLIEGRVVTLGGAQLGEAVAPGIGVVEGVLLVAAAVMGRALERRMLLPLIYVGPAEQLDVHGALVGIPIHVMAGTLGGDVAVAGVGTQVDIVAGHELVGGQGQRHHIAGLLQVHDGAMGILAGAGELQIGHVCLASSQVIDAEISHAIVLAAGNVVDAIAAYLVGMGAGGVLLVDREALVVQLVGGLPLARSEGDGGIFVVAQVVEHAVLEVQARGQEPIEGQIVVRLAPGQTIGQLHLIREGGVVPAPVVGVVLVVAPRAGVAGVARVNAPVNRLAIEGDGEVRIAAEQAVLGHIVGV